MSDVLSKQDLLSSHAWRGHIRPGHRFDIQLLSNHNKTRILSYLVGHHKDEFLVFQYEADQLPASLQVTGLMAICRYMVEGDVGACYAFKSEIMYSTKHPYDTLFLSFPEQIQHRPIRERERRFVNVPSRIFVRKSDGSLSSPMKGKVNDISEGGCGFIFDDAAANKTVKKLPVAIELEHSEGPIIVHGDIRRSKKTEDGQITAGIAFEQDLEAHQLDALLSLM